MGLQNQLTDISSDSLPIFLLTTITTGACYLHSLLLTFLNSLGIIISPYQPDDVIHDAIGSGLASLIILADQLNLNRVGSYKYSSCNEGQDQVNDNCVVCLNSLTDGDHVRKLACRHVFHKECFDGWLDCYNFKCPICRSPLVCDERVVMTRRQVAGDVMGWFSLR